QKILTENSWTRGGETLSWTGLTVIYEGSTDLYPAAKYFNVTLTDEYGGSWQDTSSTGEVFYIESEEAAISGSLSHSLAITEIPNSGTDVSVLEAFITNVDAELPPAPEKVVIHADSFTDPQVNYDNDNHIYVSWTPNPDLESEIAGYYYSLTNHEFTANGIWTTGHTGEFTGVPEVKVDVYVWAIDNAGNIGSATNGSIFIDLQTISFENAAPSSAVWQLTRTPTCSIRVNDEGGSGIDFESIQYSISEGSNTNYGNWNYAESLVIISDDSVDCSVQPYFGNGGENYIKWRAKDFAGNDYTESEEYMIKVDSQEVTFKLTTPQPKIWQNYKMVSCSVTIRDPGGSGVNAASIEYSVSTNNVYSYGVWQPAGLTNNAESIVHAVEIGFQEGKENYIKWRAADVAGNDYAVSADYNIWVNTEPQLIISAPEDYSKFLADTKIWFDASESTDFDGDTLSFYWVSDIEGAIGYSAQFIRMLSPGTHRISVYLDDGHTHNISKMLTVTSYETDTDNDGTPDHLDDDDDGDNMPDWWEELYGLNSKYGGDVNTDIDKDGYSNYKEFELNSSPLNASDPPSNGEPGTDGETTSEASEGIGDEWIIALVVIVVILIVLIVLVLIFIKKTQRRAQADSEAAKSKSGKVQEPSKGALPGLPPPKEAPVEPGSASPAPAPPPEPPAQQPSPDLSSSLPPLQSEGPKSIDQKPEQ
ncbi:MAG: hypothetical protein KAJ51_02000, partial [Thermoplasmata archaeon]|nr:hypothetical protein [Thermoplasmata archaeon]